MSQNSREFLIILKITSTYKITGEDVSSQRVLFGYLHVSAGKGKIELSQILRTLSVYTLRSIKKKDLRKNLVCSVIFLEPVTVKLT